MHPLQLVSLVSWAILTLTQLTLPWSSTPANFWLLILVLPLLLPLGGLLAGRRYTYKWVGFLTMLYFCIGISELFINPELRLYGLLTTVASVTMFLASIYLARYLGLKEREDASRESDGQAD